MTIGIWKSVRGLLLFVMAISILSCVQTSKPKPASYTGRGEELLRAVRKGDYPLVKTVLEADPLSTVYKDEFGSDALFYSVVYPHKDIFGLIFSKSDSLGKRYEEGKTILHIAVESDLEERGYFNFIAAIAGKIKDIDMRDDHGNSALWYASTYYVVNKQTIALLLKKGADIHAKNVYGQSIYSSAVESDRKELIQLLTDIN